MSDVCGLTVAFSVHCFMQVCVAVQSDIAKCHCFCQLILPLTAQNDCPRGKGEVHWFWGRSDFAECISCFTWTIFTRSLGPPEFWNPPSIPHTRRSAKPQQTVLHLKLFYNSTLRVSLLNLFSHCARMNLMFEFSLQKSIPKAGQDHMWYGGSQPPGGRVKLPCPPALPSLFRAAVCHPTHQPHWPQTLLRAQGEGREQG